MKKTIAGIVLILLVLAAFWFGTRVSFGTKIAPALEIQATLTFGNYNALQKLKGDLANGCLARAQSRIEFLILQQKMLMADYIQNYDDSKFEGYISARDAPLLEELRSVDVNWNLETVLPDCKKQISSHSASEGIVRVKPPDD